MKTTKQLTKSRSRPKLILRSSGLIPPSLLTPLRSRNGRRLKRPRVATQVSCPRRSLWRREQQTSSFIHFTTCQSSSKQRSRPNASTHKAKRPKSSDECPQLRTSTSSRVLRLGQTNWLKYKPSGLPVSSLPRQMTSSGRKCTTRRPRAW